MITYDDFKKVEIKTAKIMAVKDIPGADKLYLVDIDLGSEKTQVVAGIKKYYEPKDLIGKNVAVVTNLQPAKIRGVESKAMLLAASDSNTLSILTLDKDMPCGSSIK
jgi:methionyl-tRNA synthetase